MATRLALLHALNQAQSPNKETRGVAYRGANCSEIFKKAISIASHLQ